ncbi:MAG: hypothetical protein E6575_12400 [Bradyrhizobium sp.]|nr:hypothetical protein [Bradyrhizobium sp.]
MQVNDTKVPILAKGKTIQGHIWTYVHDDRPFGGRARPAACTGWNARWTNSRLR